MHIVASEVGSIVSAADQNLTSEIIVPKLNLCERFQFANLRRDGSCDVR